MEQFADVREHLAENLTLLCDSHHKQATNGLLPPDTITSANNSPFNVAHGVSSPFGLHFHGSEFQVVIGGNRFSCSSKTPDHSLITMPITIDDLDLLGVRSDADGRVFLHVNIFDEYNLPLLIINDNTLIYRTKIWDIAFVGKTLTIREASRKFLIEITFQPPNQILIDRARLLLNGVEIVVRKSHIFIVNSETLIVGNTVHNCSAGLQIGRNDRQLSAAFGPDPTSVIRYNLPRPDARKREVAAIARAKELSLKYGGESHDFVNPT